MFSAELQAEVKDGKIEIDIPEEFRQELQEGDAVRLVVLKAHSRFPENGIIANLTEAPIPIRGIRKLTREDLYD